MIPFIDSVLVESFHLHAFYCLGVGIRMYQILISEVSHLIRLFVLLGPHEKCSKSIFWVFCFLFVSSVHPLFPFQLFHFWILELTSCKGNL